MDRSTHAVLDPPRASSDPPRHAADALADLFVLTLGVTLALAVSGYQFGLGNHTVYLLDALRQQHPELLAKDWFTTGTLQYHAAFTYLTSGLNRLGLLRPGFLLGYLALAVLWQWSWLRWTQLLGGGRITYLLSALLFHLSAGGISVGVYQFLQDACFLPSNVSNVAMLWGLYLLARRRELPAGAWLGLAGLFHLNFAAIGLLLWATVLAWRWLDVRRAGGRRLPARPWLLGSLAIALPSLLNIGMALQVKFQHSGHLPIDEFVRIYVKFRHTHHFDALAWPAGLWFSFLWPIPLAAWAYARARRTDEAPHPTALARRETARLFLFFLALQAIALVFAGIWFVSESLVQLILWRFSIYVKLLSCLGTAWLLWDAGLAPRRLVQAALWLVPAALALLLTALLATDAAGGVLALVSRMARAHLAAVWVLVGLCAAIALYVSTARRLTEARRMVIHAAGTALLVVLLVAAWDRWLGVGLAPPPEDPDYLAVCDWARQTTPIDAVFLVPPSETAFRLSARRAIVVNFKHVPQLGGEMPEWLARLRTVLGMTDLDRLPRGYNEVMDAIAERYDARGPSDLASAARRYGARYVVATRVMDHPQLGSVAFTSPNGRYFVYDRGAPAGADGGAEGEERAR